MRAPTRAREARPSAALLLVLLAVLAGTAACATPLWLGVAVRGGKDGEITVAHVFRHSAAEVAGLGEGDRILAAGGAPVHDVRELFARVREYGEGRALPLRIQRGGVDREVRVVVTPNPGYDEALRREWTGVLAPSWSSAAPVAGAVPADIEGLRGRVVIVSFWASWCGYCRLEAPLLSQWQDAYATRGLTVIGITPDPVPTASAARSSFGIRFPVVSDEGGEIARAYTVAAWPTLFLADKQGKIRHVYAGYNPRGRHAVEQAIEELLAE